MLRTTLRLGNRAPDFKAEDQSGKIVRLSDLRGRWVVLYFYPKDRTRGCTAEACGFRNRLDSLMAEEADVIGVSRDSVVSHKEFARRHNLGFRLLADPEGDIVRAFRANGILGWPRRMTYILDPDGHIVKAYKWVRPKGHAQAVLSDLRDLKSKRGRIARIGAANPV